MEEKEWNWNGELCEGARRGELGGGGSRKMNMRTELEKREGERRRRRRRSRRRRRRGGILVTSEAEIRCLPFQGSQIRKECTAADTIQSI